MNASDVECPTCEADPGRNCRGMTLPDVHFTRAMRADVQTGRAAGDAR